MVTTTKHKTTMYQSKEATWVRQQELWAAFYPVNICEPPVNGNKKLARCAWGSPYELPLTSISVCHLATDGLCSTGSTLFMTLKWRDCCLVFPHQITDSEPGTFRSGLVLRRPEPTCSLYLDDCYNHKGCGYVQTTGRSVQYYKWTQSYHGEQSVTKSCKGMFSLYNEQQRATEAEYKV